MSNSFLWCRILVPLWTFKACPHTAGKRKWMVQICAFLWQHRRHCEFSTCLEGSSWGLLIAALEKALSPLKDCRGCFESTITVFKAPLVLQCHTPTHLFDCSISECWMKYTGNLLVKFRCPAAKLHFMLSKMFNWPAAFFYTCQRCWIWPFLKLS